MIGSHLTTLIGDVRLSCLPVIGFGVLRLFYRASWTTLRYLRTRITLLTFHHGEPHPVGLRGRLTAILLVRANLLHHCQEKHIMGQCLPLVMVLAKRLQLIARGLMAPGNQRHSRQMGLYQAHRLNLTGLLIQAPLDELRNHPRDRNISSPYHSSKTRIMVSQLLAVSSREHGHNNTHHITNFKRRLLASRELGERIPYFGSTSMYALPILLGGDFS